MLSRNSALGLVSMLVLLAGFNILAVENTNAPTVPEPQESRTASTAAPEGETDLGWLQDLEQGKVATAGCYAEQLCEATPGSVSCTAGSGTCTASFSGCGKVTCNGVTTQCPGACIGDHHCAVFCDWQPNSYCRYGCCRCVP